MENILLHIGAAYIRVSDERQDEYSPDSQLKKIREYAAKDGYMIPDEYVFYDDGISGKSARKRDDFNRMIAIAKEKDHPFDVIYVWKFSRFARNQEESMVYKNLLRKKGVSVISVSEPIPEGHFGTLIERIIEWMDEFYLINLGTEVVRGMTEKASRGEPTCPPPYGYIMRDKKYYPDESGPADIVREVFRRYANGEGQREIATSLGKRGVRTKFGNMPENRWIDYMLQNPCYIGMIRWSPDGSRAVSRRQLDNENIMTVAGNHEPLISEELWKQVQARIEKQKKAYSSYARREQPVEYMLKGLVRCSSCGGTLAINGFSGKSRVRCLQCCNYARGACHTSHSITLPRINEAFIVGLDQAVGAQVFHITPKKPKDSTDKTVDYNKLISIEEKKLERARDAYLAEVDTMEQYAEKKAEISDRIAKLKQMQAQASTSQTVDISAYAGKVAKVVEFIKRNDVTESAKNEALRTIIDSVIYDKPHGSLAIHFYT